MAQSSSIVPPAQLKVTGRPTLLTRELQDGICELIRKGNRPAEAAGCFGVDQATYFRWMQRGKAGEEPWREFRESVTTAVADAKEGLVALIRSAAEKDPKNWKAAAHVLDRLDPRGAAIHAPSKPESFDWVTFERETLQRMAILEERKRVLAERERDQHALLAPAPDDSGAGIR